MVDVFIEPAEKIAKAHGTAGANLEDKIVETITFSDGPMKSTVEDVMEVARKVSQENL